MSDIAKQKAFKVLRLYDTLITEIFATGQKSNTNESHQPFLNT